MHSYDPVHDVTRTWGTQVPVNAPGLPGDVGVWRAELPQPATMPHAAAIMAQLRITTSFIGFTDHTKSPTRQRASP
jgi:hypothetical protein